MLFAHTRVMVRVAVLIGALNVVVRLPLVEDIALAPMYVNWKCNRGGLHDPMETSYELTTLTLPQ